MRNALLLITAALALAAPAIALAPPAAYVVAVEKAGRPADAVALDADRKPAEVLAFLGLKPGMQAADIMTGSGYWAEIMAGVVGPKGTVTAYEPNQFYATPKQQAVVDALLARHPAIRLVRYPFDQFAAAPKSLDFVMINLNYHDLYWESAKYHIPHTDPAAFLRVLFAAMKPGGVVGIVDHVGKPGVDTRALVEDLHRIDPEVVKADFARAGFVLEASSEMLRNPADDHTKGVFDKDIQGKTDRFVFRFRKAR